MSWRAIMVQKHHIPTGVPEFAQAPFDCNGDCINDADNDGVCDEFEIAGFPNPRTARCFCHR